MKNDVMNGLVNASMEQTDTAEPENVSSAAPAEQESSMTTEELLRICQELLATRDEQEESSQDEEDADHQFDLLLHHAHGLGHVAGEPLDVFHENLTREICFELTKQISTICFLRAISFKRDERNCLI